MLTDLDIRELYLRAERPPSASTPVEQMITQMRAERKPPDEIQAAVDRWRAGE